MKKTNAIRYSFSAIPWKHASPGGWHFVSLPPELAEDIRLLHKNEEEGWGRLKVCATIGKSEWETAIWFDTKLKTYLLPLKASVRKKEIITSGESAVINIYI